MAETHPGEQYAYVIRDQKVVEYEETPTTFSTSEVLPPQALSEPQGSEDEEQEQDVDDVEEEEEDDEEEEQVEGTESGPNPGVKTKAKRIIKQRQSLSEKQPGTTIFPISRVKKICKADKELDIMTSEATFMVSVATEEYFIKHFMEEGCTKARLDRRKLVTYKDMANVVARSEEFDFLRDVIPLPIPMSEALRARKEKQANDDNPMDDDDETGPLDLGSDILPPLTHSTNPLFPNAIVKRPPNTHARAAGAPAPAAKASKAAAAAAALEEREAKERERRAAILHAGPSAQTKPFGLKNAPTVAQSLTTRSRRSLAASDAGAELAEARDALIPGEEVPEQATTMPEEDRMEQD